MQTDLWTDRHSDTITYYELIFLHFLQTTQKQQNLFLE